MSSLSIGRTTYTLNTAYRDGALAARNGETTECSISASEEHRRSWNQGFQNERRRVHIIDGIDIISFPTASDSYSVAEPSLKDPRPKASQLAYDRQLMVASGMYADALDQMTANLGITPAALRRALQQRGHALTTEFANLVIRRIRLDWQMEGEALTPSQSQALSRLTDFKKQVLLTAGELQDTYYDTNVPNATLARRFNQRSSWPNAMGSNFKREGLGFLVTFSGTSCTLTAKGWTVVNDLRADLAREAAAQENHDSLMPRI